MSNVPPRFRAIRNESSGDPLADRRFAYAEACRAEGDLAAADDLYRQTLERVPDWLPALAGLAQVLHEQGREAEALAIARAGLAADPADRMGLALFLAERGEAAEGAIRPGYLAALFDAYADGFDAHLTGALGYVAPGYLAQRLAPDPAALWRGHWLCFSRDLAVATEAPQGRTFSNHAQLLEQLSNAGVLIIDPGRHDIRQLQLLVAAARGFVGIHGAGLFNALLGPAGARVLEIRPACGCWRTVEFLCRAAGLDWQPIACERDPLDPERSVIPIDAVLALLK